MARVLRAFFLVLVVVLLGAFAYEGWKNPEKIPLDASARSAAPGKFVTLSDGMTHYQVAGPETGQVVVLVHGFSVPMYIWDSTFVALSAAGFRVIRYDLFGRGWSDRPDVAYDGNMYDRQLDELLDSLRVSQPVNLVGLSFGGFVTSHYTVSHPRRVRTLTMVDPSSTSRTLPGLLTTPVIGPWVWQVSQVPGMAEGQASDFLHPEHYPTWADQYRPQMEYKGFGRALLRSAITSSKTDFPALFADVSKTSVPVLLVWGKQDQTVPIALSEVARTNIPALQFFPVDSAGHLPHIEQAALVNAKLQNFFSAPSMLAVPTP
jgi:pimeloyl-ACP methyl ester carboxylesterase